MSDDGFHVDLKGIDGYAGKLSGDTALASEVSGLVAQSDVGDQSWGIVGLFVKSKYTEMLGDLDELLGDMKDGLRSGADKMTACAQTYRDIDTAIAKIFNDALKGGA
ncbi:ESX-1 secretion-associated protein [Actinophytocola sp.]|uniref:ESX-1 secretion-associated protein n=1 Tax=Actinophytocola sp. TaxID=1872138 RepID=UPI00389A497F